MQAALAGVIGGADHRSRRGVAEQGRQFPDQFVVEEIDPLLEKISQSGLASLSRRERRLLERAGEKMLTLRRGRAAASGFPQF